MIEIFLGLVLLILVFVNIRYEMRRSAHIVITLVILLLFVTISSSYVFYKKHSLTFWDYWDYKNQALNFSKEYDPAHTYEFVDIENQGCRMMIGCTFVVKLESTSSGDKLDILLMKGRVVPLSSPRKKTSES
ncbi:hypothetical protein [Paenibacillus sp. N3.4]|uniref:hypothetical protein n=1 Tax=Paenibacillus sp. N3.4 TaxID=2603222 RepID=UPI0011C70890|nr:hypothetical protein [Paenibacillus sp. N3.4]TXK85752.1 hypothetical protein FU659_02265 [Paenibacillus sp. N3.4]